MKTFLKKLKFARRVDSSATHNKYVHFVTSNQYGRMHRIISHEPNSTKDNNGILSTENHIIQFSSKDDNNNSSPIQIIVHDGVTYELDNSLGYTHKTIIEKVLNFMNISPSKLTNGYIYNPSLMTREHIKNEIWMFEYRGESYFVLSQ